MQPIPTIDLFAGPGGLGEGFSRVLSKGRAAFQNVLSIEKDLAARRTLTLRAFCRQFRGDLPQAYCDRVRGLITTEDLFAKFPVQAKVAQHEAWRAELGSEDFPLGAVRQRVREALAGAKDWVLLGGPPCQAYSLVGRSRNRGISGYRLESDHRATLYVEYLQVIADFAPSVFVMENVKGLLSAKLDGESVFARILADLSHPAVALAREVRPRPLRGNGLRYRLYPIVAPQHGLFDGTAASASTDPRDFVVRAERFGVPQARHRIIVIGVREDFASAGPRPLDEQENQVTVRHVLKGLPKLRSGLSREDDSPDAWARVVAEVGKAYWLKELTTRDLSTVRDRIKEVAHGAERLARRPRDADGKEPVAPTHTDPSWFETERLGCVANHASRSHMRSDLARYLFAAAFAESQARSPELNDFPAALLPDHRNCFNALAGSHFADRFRVQRWTRPSTTVTSHISSDGHYYIHPDPEQCRSHSIAGKVTMNQWGRNAA